MKPYNPRNETPCDYCTAEAGEDCMPDCPSLTLSGPYTIGPHA